MLDEKQCNSHKQRSTSTATLYLRFFARRMRPHGTYCIDVFSQGESKPSTKIYSVQQVTVSAKEVISEAHGQSGCQEASQGSRSAEDGAAERAGGPAASFPDAHGAGTDQRVATTTTLAAGRCVVAEVGECAGIQLDPAVLFCLGV